MYLAYSLLLTLGLLVLIPHFIFQAFVHGKYIDGLRQRLGSLTHLKQFRGPVIWLHCVSVGETQAARPLVKQLRAEFPDHALLVSTITATGQKLAQQVFQGEAKGVFYFPFDWKWTVRRAIKVINPNVWDTLFQTALINTLASNLCMALRGDRVLANDLIKEVNTAIETARSIDGNEGLTINDFTPDWIRVRGFTSEGFVGPFSNFDWGGGWPSIA